MLNLLQQGTPTPAHLRKCVWSCCFLYKTYWHCEGKLLYLLVSRWNTACNNPHLLLEITGRNVKLKHEAAGQTRRGTMQATEGQEMKYVIKACAMPNKAFSVLNSLVDFRVEPQGPVRIQFQLQPLHQFCVRCVIATSSLSCIHSPQRATKNSADTVLCLHRPWKYYRWATSFFQCGGDTCASEVGKKVYQEGAQELKLYMVDKYTVNESGKEVPLHAIVLVIF